MAGWRRILYIMFFAQLLSAVGFSIIFPFLSLYVAELGTTTGLTIEFWAGMVFSAQAFTMMFSAPIWGAVADRYGRKLMVERAMFGGAIILALMAFAQSAEQLVLLRAIQGLITGTVAASNALVAANAPRERVGFAMGLLQVGQWGGVAVGPLIGGVLADLFGFGAPFLVTSGLLFVAGLMVLFGVEEDFAPSDSIRERRVGFVGEWRHVFSMDGVPPTFLMRFMLGLGRSMILPIAPLYILSLMSSPEGVSTITGLFVGIGSATATASGVYLGRLGDRIGHRRIVIVCALAAGLIYIPQALVSSAWQMVALQGLVGIAVGGLVSSPSALLARYTDPGEEGAVYGLDNSIFAASRTISPLVGAAIASALGARGVFLAAAFMMLLIALLAARFLPEASVKGELKAA